MIKLKKRLPPWTVLLACISLAFLVRTSILNINASAEKSYKSRILLAEFAKYLHNIDALEWKLIGKKEVGKELDEQINQARKSADDLLKKIQDNDDNKQITIKIYNLYEKYQQLLEKEIRLINEHRTQQASQLDNEQVDPNFSLLENEINQLSDFYENQEKKSIGTSNVEITIVLFLASIFIGGLF